MKGAESKTDLPYFKWYPKDCDVNEDVRAMDDRELGFYIRCLNHSWVNGSLPADVSEIARIMKSPRSYVAKIWPRVSRCFAPSEDPARLVNNRQEEERSKAIRKSEKATDSIRKRYECTYERSSNVVPRAFTRAESDSLSESVVDVCSSEKTTTPEVSTSALAVATSGVGEVFDELKSIYRQAGKPIPEKHENIAVQMLLGIPQDRLPRVPNYVKWALVSGTWSDAAHTKSLLNLLRDGDWDVEITQRTLPTPDKRPHRLTAEEIAAL